MRRADLTPAQTAEMYSLLSAYFTGVTPERFADDLAEKDWVILLVADGAIRGFSTLMQMDAAVDGEPVVAFFSGDTIVDHRYWGELELHRQWAGHVFALADRVEGARVFWFLISSGYKTYRFLPVFFREFYPRYDQATPPFPKAVLDALGAQKYGSAYDAGRGVIRLSEPTPLREGVAAVDERRLKDPHVTFFMQANPGHAAGDELACLAELARSNLTRAGQRMVGPS